MDTTNNSTNDVTNTTTYAHMDMYSDTPQGGVDGLVSGKYLTNARKVDDTTTDTGKSALNGTVNNTERHSENTQDDIDRNVTVETSDTVNSDRERSVNETHDNSVTEQSSLSRDKKLVTVDDYIERVTGKTSGASYSKILMEFRQTFLNIDMMVIDELENLFMQLW